MVTVQLFPIFQILAFLCVPSSMSYPIYGTKRYGRSSTGHKNNPSWGVPVQPYQQFLRSQRYPMNYYEMYPYNQDYTDDYYYPQDGLTYPVYYPPPRTSKYEVYQAVLPYYYGDRPFMRPGYGYYGYDKNSERVDDLEEELLQDAEREEREESQPIGQEVLYENDGNSDDNLDDVNAAFLQNLIMSQMYKDALNNQKNYYDQYGNSDYYNEDDSFSRWGEPIDLRDSYNEDEDVKELKQLAKPQKSNKHKTEKKPTINERNQAFRSKNVNKKQKQHDSPFSWEEKRNSAAKSLSANKKEEFSEHGPLVFGKSDLTFSDRKPTIKLGSASSTIPTAEPLTTESSKKDPKGGQKEEVLIRPATPVRHPFSGQILEILNKNEPERKRTPSVYDTIKQMLNMEKNLENKYRSNEIRPQMRKRIVSSEDSLTHQLSVLKKAPL